MSRTTADTIEDRREKIADARDTLENIERALRDAESCETPKDFDANLADAIAWAKALLTELREVKS